MMCDKSGMKTAKRIDKASFGGYDRKGKSERNLFQLFYHNEDKF